jgi:ankyrin repeat protein
LVDELIQIDAELINMVDSKGNTPLHIASRKGRAQVIYVRFSVVHRRIHLCGKG